VECRLKLFERLKTNNKVLIISLGYLPTVGGSYRVLHELIDRDFKDDIDVLTCKDNLAFKFDSVQKYKIKRSLFLSILNDSATLLGNFTILSLNKLLFFRFIIKSFKYIVFPVVSFFFIFFFVFTKKYKTLVFAQSVLPFAWYIPIFKVVFNFKILTFVYGEDIVSFRKSGRVSGFLRKIYLKGLYYSDTIIANSLVTQDEVVRDGISKEKVSIVNPAVDYDFFKPFSKDLAKEQFDLEGKYVLLSVGRLIRRKGFDTVLSILPELLKDIPNLIYVIRGEGYDKDYLQNIVTRNNLSDHVRFIDDLPYEKLPVLYSASDVFILANRLDEKDNEQEGFGIVFLEANACGLPVIGGNSGGVKDVIEEGVNGFLIDPSLPNEIKNIVLKINNQTLVLDGHSTRSFVKEKYNWDRSVKVFNGLLN